MFFCVKQSGLRQYLQIVENFREEGRVRQRVLTTLGRLDELRRSGNLDRLLDAGLYYTFAATSGIPFLKVLSTGLGRLVYIVC